MQQPKYGREVLHVLDRPAIRELAYIAESTIRPRGRADLCLILPNCISNTLNNIKVRKQLKSKLLS